MLVLDRRLLPGDDPEAAVAEVAAALEDLVRGDDFVALDQLVDAASIYAGAIRGVSETAG